MSTNYSFVGETNRNSAMSAVADTMNSLNLDILKATMEMGGKQVVEKDGAAFALERVSSSEVNSIKSNAVDVEVKVGDTVFTKGDDENFYGIVDGQEYQAQYNNGSVAFYAKNGEDIATDPTVLDDVTIQASANVTNTDTAMAIFDILGINPASDIDGGIASDNWKVSLSVDGDNVTLKVAYVDKNTGDTMVMGVNLDDNGRCVGLSELTNKGNESLEVAMNGIGTIVDVDSGGLLESWGISNPEELQPGDLFLVQQKLQIIKDIVSTVHTTGKTQGDIMREATQKFAQG